MGFFFAGGKKATKASSASRASNVSVETLHRMECAVCPLNDAVCHTPKMKPAGTKPRRHPELYVLGECPSPGDDKHGKHYYGLGRELFYSNFYDEELEDHTRINYAVRTKPPKNRIPTTVELECCRPSIERDIEATKPRVILAQGYLAIKWLLNYIDPNLADGQRDQPAVWHGRWAPVNINGRAYWATFTYDPHWVMQQDRQFETAKGDKKNVDSIFKPLYRQQVMDAFDWAVSNKLKQPKIPADKELRSNIAIYNGEYKECLAELEKLRGKSNLAFDIETSALRPFDGNQRILTASIGDKKRTIAFAVDHKESKFTKKQRQNLFMRMLLVMAEAKRVVGHNVKFDLEWVLYFYGTQWAYDINWEDTQAQGYLLDVRKYGLSLDFLCAQNFGIGLKKLSNMDRSKLDQYPVDDVLHYNALDVKWTLKLYNKQNVKLRRNKLKDAYHMHVKRVPTLSLTQLIGVPVNQKRVRNLQAKQGKRIAKLENEIHADPDFKKFANKEQNTNIASPEVMAKFFGDFLGMPEVRLESGKLSTKKEILDYLNHPVAEKLREYRTQSKNKSTYLDGISIKDKGELIWPDGCMHTSYNSEFSSTGRLTSSDPNLQNFPKRKDAWIRKVVKPSQANAWAAHREIEELMRHSDEPLVMLAADYGQVEARGIALASQDDYMCRSVWSGNDVHMEWAKRIAKAYPQRIGGKAYLDDPGAMKAFRTDIKNQWTFPAFYGASLYSISGYLGIPMKIVEPIFKDFWRTFEGILKWQQSLDYEYEQYGYVTTLTGRRRYAPMTRNEYINAPIQGMASDLVVHAMNELSRLAVQQQDWHLHPRLNIHDDLTFIVPKRQYKEYANTIARHMLNPHNWPFINIPLLVEMEVGPDWAALEEFAAYETPDFFPEFTQEAVYDSQVA